MFLPTANPDEPKIVSSIVIPSICQVFIMLPNSSGCGNSPRPNIFIPIAHDDQSETIIQPFELSFSEAFASVDPPIPFSGAGFAPPQPDVVGVNFSLRILDYSWQQPLCRTIARWLRVFVEGDQVVELRALNVATDKGAKVAWSGFYSFANLDQMAADSVKRIVGAEGVYFTLNPLDPSLLARRCNRVEIAKDTAADVDVVKRRWLLVDADPVRKSGISATIEEKQQAWNTVRAVHKWLQDHA